MSNNSSSTSSGQLQGRVIARYGAELLVEIPPHTRVRCTAKRKFDQVACGDNVTIALAEHGNARLMDIAPRKNALTRPDHRHRLKTIAANIDQLVVVVSWRPAPFWELLDRYLVTAHQLDASAVVVMNKEDLAGQYASAEALEALKEYACIGYPVIRTVAMTDAVMQEGGLSDLQKILNGKTNILVGQSGVGKSSLANALLPDKEIMVGEISQFGEGRHTTTTTTLYALPGGGELVDSPGVRDFVLPDITKSQLREGFREYAAYSSGCKFNNCTHAHEPGCRVREAVEMGELAGRRYQRYLKLLADIH